MTTETTPAAPSGTVGADVWQPVCRTCGTTLVPSHHIGPEATWPIWKCLTCNFRILRDQSPNAKLCGSPSAPGTVRKETP